MTEYVREWEDVYRALINEVLRGIEFALQPFAHSLDAFLAELFSARLPSDWRDRWHAFVAEQATLGFFVDPVSIRDLEIWIEEWAEYCGLLPIEELVSERSVSFAESFAAEEGERPFVITYTPDVSGPGPTDVSLGSNSPGDIVVKPQFPADRRGKWLSGTKGEGVFRYHDIPENRAVGLANKEIRFAGQYIAVGGFPAEAYYGGSAEAAKVEIEVVTGTTADKNAAVEEMRVKLKNSNWQQPKGFLWNHAGPPGSKVLELVREDFHTEVHHTGSAAFARARSRLAKSMRGGGRVLGIVNVYLVARDILQAAGALQPEYNVAEREAYHFLSEDGSVFVAYPRWLVFSPYIVFVAGFRKGETQKITTMEFEQLKKQAESRWGKYIPGSLLSEPRFIPGTERKSLPLVREEDGVQIGWIDEKGVHKYTRIPGIRS